MKIFHCDACGALLFFENVSCLQCGKALGFREDVMDLTTLEASPQGGWVTVASDSAPKRRYKSCSNGREYGVCNWLVAWEEKEERCVACRLNSFIPNASDKTSRDLWHKIEKAKRRLVYTLKRLELLPLTDRGGQVVPLQFRFLADTPGRPPVMTGHEGGVITLNIAEADDAERERRRTALHEPMRTLVGHFRHESGHYYWDRLIANKPSLNTFRELFGDERADYGAALARYYAQGPLPDWMERGVSAYASAHPWEDWAETWAHYLHMVDLLETASSFGLSLHPQHPAAETLVAEPEESLLRGASFDAMLRHWYPLTYALNSLNRGMGLNDYYPFVLSATALSKLRYVHQLIEESRSNTIPAPASRSTSPASAPSPPFVQTSS